jgi:hypothetical protein
MIAKDETKRRFILDFLNKVGFDSFVYENTITPTQKKLRETEFKL